MSERELTEARIKEIEYILQDVEIIEHQKNSDEIRYGSKVKIEDDKGKKYEITIVGSGEVDILENTVSFQSPVGRALRGKSK
jgi:transcription elongation factor GreA